MSTPLIWLITGASSGFGATLTLQVLRSGHHAICAVRSPAKASASNPEITDLGGKWIVLDVTSDFKTVNSSVSAAVEIFGRLDVVVNSAGYCILGSVEDIRYFSPSVYVHFASVCQIVQRTLGNLSMIKEGFRIFLNYFF